MPQEVSKWKCIYCNSLYDTKDQAQQCEYDHDSIDHERIVVGEWSRGHKHPHTITVHFLDGSKKDYTAET